MESFGGPTGSEARGGPPHPPTVSPLLDVKYFCFSGQIIVTLESNGKTLKNKAISKLKKTKSSEIRIVRAESSTLGVKKNVKAKNTITLDTTEKDEHTNLSTLDATEKDVPKKPNTLGAKENDEDTLDQIVNDSDDNVNDFDSNGEDSDYTNTEVLDSKDNFKIDQKTEKGINRTPVKSKAGTGMSVCYGLTSKPNTNKENS